jgi:nucleoside-diphosphate-sugar epimerase
MVVDGLDREAVIAAVGAAAPEVIVHQMTVLADVRSLRKPDKVFAATNELRTRGTDNLLAAAARAGTRRVIAQGNAGLYERSGGPVKTEEDPLDSRPPSPSSARSLAAIKHVEEAVPLGAPVAEWLPYLAEVAGAKPPLRVPAWLGRLLAGEFAVAQMTSMRGSSNEKARKELGWEPRYASWREGFRAWVGG